MVNNMTYTNETGTVTYDVYTDEIQGRDYWTFRSWDKNMNIVHKGLGRSYFETEELCKLFIESLFSTTLIPTGIKQGLSIVEGDPYGGIS